MLRVSLHLSTILLSRYCNVMLLRYCSHYCRAYVTQGTTNSTMLLQYIINRPCYDLRIRTEFISLYYDGSSTARYAVLSYQKAQCSKL